MRLKMATLTVAMAGVILVGCSSSGGTAENGTDNGTVDSVIESNASTETLIHGISKPEDLVTVPGSPWVLASSMASEKLQMDGGLFAIDSTVGEPQALWPSETTLYEWDRLAYPDCPGVPDATTAQPHGINVQGRAGSSPDVLFAINHGRHSVEVFQLTEGEDLLTATWVGCVIVPADVSANGITPLPNEEGFLITSMYDPTAAGDPFARMFAGEDTGRLMKWSSDAAWEEIPNSSLGGANGVVVTRDGQHALAAGWTQRTVAKIALDGSGERETLDVPFLPDNLRWTDRDTVLVTGHDITAEDVATCNAGEGTSCPTGYEVLEIDPDTMTTAEIIDGANSSVSLATTAVQVGTEIWIGSIAGDKIYRVSTGE